MNRSILVALPLVLMLAPAIASAQDGDPPELCPDRPGKASPTCVVAPGNFQVETSIADWSHDHQAGETEDMILFGDSLLRYGVADRVEVRVAVTPYIHDRTRSDGAVSVADGFGDVGLSARYLAIDGSESGPSLALMPGVTLPLGAHDVSQGTWSASLFTPVDLPLSDGWSLAATPGVFARADEDGDGRHFAYSGAGAVSKDVGGGVTLTGELWAMRDEDPAGHVTQGSLDLLGAWQSDADTQFDLSSYIGLTRDTPDIEILGGFTRRFR
ncbi:transporter [Stakelama sp. CBK3Z-3]|uniref:Transporter n=1 Tax=Stakelama flava TaxID=2860338 RepID=A0ABS6XNQ1_9SPHN|nr:transporter [Stakelama flava]MBW4331839.1 transporter [Stakelama flava]